nr:hypothetical protein [Streptomyces viridosporus]
MLSAAWPFTRPVRMLTAPPGHLTRPHVVHRSRDAQPGTRTPRRGVGTRPTTAPCPGRPRPGSSAGRPPRAPTAARPDPVPSFSASRHRGTAPGTSAGSRHRERDLEDHRWEAPRRLGRPMCGCCRS